MYLSNTRCQPFSIGLPVVLEPKFGASHIIRLPANNCFVLRSDTCQLSHIPKNSSAVDRWPREVEVDITVAIEVILLVRSFYFPALFTAKIKQFDVSLNPFTKQRVFFLNASPEQTENGKCNVGSQSLVRRKTQNVHRKQPYTILRKAPKGILGHLPRLRVIFTVYCENNTGKAHGPFVSGPKAATFPTFPCKNLHPR